MRFADGLLGATSCIILMPVKAHAYMVGTAVSDDCHERITAEAFAEIEVALYPEASSLPAPGAWQNLSEWVAEKYGFESEPLEVQYALMSLFLGVREPDTGGQSALNAKAARLTHGGFDLYIHCTRKADDDGPEADLRVVEACRDRVQRAIDRGGNMYQRVDQNQRVSAALDFYGEIAIDVWGPAYEMGRGLHTLQDSFSHTVRSEDLREVWHVVNFIDAIESHYVESRDGMRHSVSWDHCDSSTEEIVDSVREASIALIEAAYLQWEEDDRAAVTREVLDPWLRYVPGCGTPGYCDSPWLEIGQESLTEPYVVRCSVERGSPRRAWGACAILVVLGWCRRRGRSR